MGALFGGLGGVLFSIKWLYHSVAKEIWNRDRRLWRIFTPVVSMTLALGMIAIVNSRLFGVFDPALVNTQSRAAALGFLIGLFSDNTVAKLAEIAESVFGTTRRGGSRSTPAQHDHRHSADSSEQNSAPKLHE
jgi:hypothetical protein